MFDVPVLIIIFNRPDTTDKVFQAVRQMKPKRLFIAANAPRPDKEGEYEKCQGARNIVTKIDWDCDLQTRFHDNYLVCKESVSSAITWFFQNVEEGIVLEDDTVPNQEFFRFCKELLARYRNDTRIGMISGDNFQGALTRTPYSYYYSYFTHIWGWASWRRVWQHYDVKMKLWPALKEGNWLKDLLGDDRCVQYWTDIFDRVYNDGIDTWDYQATFALWANSMLTILPTSNLISNIGFRSDATHTKSDSPFANMAYEELRFPLSHPPYVIRDAVADRVSEKRVFGISIEEPDTSRWLKKADLLAVVSDESTRVNQAIDFALKQLEIGSAQSGLQALIEAKKARNPVKDLDHVRALCFIELGRLGDARECLREELRYFPDNENARTLLQQVLEEEAKQNTAAIAASPEDFRQLLPVIRPYTMLPEPRLVTLHKLAKYICAQNVPGNFVECGVAGGGSSGLLSFIMKNDSAQTRLLFAFDSFEGMPVPSEFDTVEGKEADATGWGTGTCAAPEESVKEICEKLGTLNLLRPVKGYFEQTLPVMKSSVGTIALLHADCDWYESAKAVLDNLYDLVVPGGVILFDDYGYWEGIKLAIGEFEKSRGIKLQVKDEGGSGWVIKQ